MALDLILGRTGRDWSCGGAATPPAPERPWDGLPEAPRQAEAVRSLMSSTAATAIRMRRTGRLPETEWRSFGQLHRRWLALSDARRGRWRESDSLPLWNLRESCEAFADRWKAMDELSQGAGKALVPATPVAASPAAGPWYAALGAALALAGVGVYSSLRGRN